MPVTTVSFQALFLHFRNCFDILGSALTFQLPVCIPGHAFRFQALILQLHGNH